MPSPIVYLAGFDVFRRDAVAHGERLKRLCHQHALHGLYPFDNELPAELSGQTAAKAICNANLDMLRRCDAVLANLGTFRGLEPDSGTAFEIGFAVALGKPVWAYFEPVASLRAVVPHDAQGFDVDGFQVEDFGLPRNLMLACTWAGVSDTAETAVPALAQYLARTHQK